MTVNFLIAILGWLIFNMWIFRNEKNNADERGEKFNYAQYIAHNWEDWLLSLLCTPILALYLSDIVALFNFYTGLNVPVYEVYYAGCGVLLKGLDKVFSVIIKSVK